MKIINEIWVLPPVILERWQLSGNLSFWWKSETSQAKGHLQIWSLKDREPGLTNTQKVEIAVAVKKQPQECREPVRKRWQDTAYNLESESEAAFLFFKWSGSTLILEKHWENHLIVLFAFQVVTQTSKLILKHITYVFLRSLVSLSPVPYCWKSLKTVELHGSVQSPRDQKEALPIWSLGAVPAVMWFCYKAISCNWRALKYHLLV
jgi:hypothetical protein